MDKVNRMQGFWKTGRASAMVLGLYCNLLPGVGCAQLVQSEPILLWPQGAPGALGTEEKDRPTLTRYAAPADRFTSAAIVVCPGGGYGSLTAHEGADYAHWLNEMGITAFVLRYRLGSQGYRHPAMLHDAARAVRFVRAGAMEWKIDPARIGVMGSSAGGHLASTLLTHFDSGDPGSTDTVERQSSRPDLGILCYPVISFGEKGHRGSQRNLLGENPSADLLTYLSNELHVSRETPPTFLFHTADDPVVLVENSLLFAQALANHKVPFALHVYPSGPHGLGLGNVGEKKPPRHPWTTQCELWLRQQGFAR